MNSDTPFGDDGVIKDQINAGISLADAVNTVVEKYDLRRTDRQGFSCLEQSPFITLIDIHRARKTTGLMTRRSYIGVMSATLGQRPQERK